MIFVSGDNSRTTPTYFAHIRLARHWTSLRPRDSGVQQCLGILGRWICQCYRVQGVVDARLIIDVEVHSSKPRRVGHALKRLYWPPIVEMHRLLINANLTCPRARR